MKIKHSREDYLECILVLSRSKGHVRAVDIAEHLGFSKPSVSRALALLADDGLIMVGEDHHITLTGAGQAIAGAVYEKHVFFKEMLESAGVEAATAAEDACKIEHAISDEAFNKIKAAYLKNQGGA